MCVFDRMSESDRLDIIKTQLLPFQTLLLHYPIANKDKFVVLVCKDPALCFFINSDVNLNYLKSRFTQNCLIPIYKEELPCLNSKKPSFIHCGDVINNFSFDDILSQLLNDFSRIKGQIDSSIWPKVIEIVKMNKRISPIQKKQILKFIG